MKIGILLNCGVCCFLLSIWAVIQLVSMGIFYKIEAIVLFEDVEQHECGDENNKYKCGYHEFIAKTKSNYKSTAINCWIAAGVYALFIVISFFCIRKGKSLARREAEKLQDEEVVCNPPGSITSRATPAFHAPRNATSSPAHQ